jgi:hypothetical protein
VPTKSIKIQENHNRQIVVFIRFECRLILIEGSDLVAGNFVFKAENPTQTIAELKELTSI